MVPTYVLAVDHRHEEIVLSVRGTKAFGDVITVSHFLPEPFLDGYVSLCLGSHRDSKESFIWTGTTACSSTCFQPLALDHGKW